MSSETLEELKSIIDNAPEGAEIIDIEEDGCIDYLYYDKSAGSGEKIRLCKNSGDADIAYSCGNIRKLSDIKHIIGLKSKLDGFKKICTDNGICLDCGTHWKHHCDEPFASCECKTGEDTEMKSPYMQLQKRDFQLHLENKELKERLDKYE